MKKIKRESIVSAEVRYSDKLTSFAKLVYGELTSLMNEKGICYEQNSYFEDVFNVCGRHVTRAISNLAEQGFIDVTIKNGNEREIFVKDYKNIIDFSSTKKESK